jgi:KDO2-lipid IV(A) lauroyltransferase
MSEHHHGSAPGQAHGEAFAAPPRLVVPADVAYLAAPFLPMSWMYAVARAQGRLQHLLRRRERETLRANFSRYFGHGRSPAEIDRMARRFFEYEQVRRVQLAVAPRLSLAQLSGMFPLEGLEHLDQAVARKKGAFLLGCHLNSISMFITIMMLRDRGYDIQVAMPQPDDPWVSSRLRRAFDRLSGGRSLAERLGAFYCQFNIRPIVRRLALNVIVSQTGDGWHSARFVRVPFLGRELPFTTGVMSVAQMTGAMVVPMFEVGAPPRMRFVAEEPFLVDKGPDAEAAVRKAVAAYVKRLEHHLLQNIECWQHWRVENTLETMAGWPERPLDQRYHM